LISLGNKKTDEVILRQLVFGCTSLKFREVILKNEEKDQTKKLNAVLEHARFKDRRDATLSKGLATHAPRGKASSTSGSCFACGKEYPHKDRPCPAKDKSVYYFCFSSFEVIKNSNCLVFNF